MDIQVLERTIADMEMDLEELVFERLGMSYEDLLYDLHYRIVECKNNFDDIERVEI